MGLRNLYSRISVRLGEQDELAPPPTFRPYNYYVPANPVPVSVAEPTLPLEDEDEDKGVPLPESLNRNLAGQIQLSQLHCCGITEISGLIHYKSAYRNLDQRTEVPRLVLRDVMMRRPPAKGGYLLFTQAILPDEKYTSNYGSTSVQIHYGDNLRDYILESRLGEIFAAPKVHNSNSGNTVTAYFWKPDAEACKLWFANEFGKDAVKFYGGYLPRDLHGAEIRQYWQDLDTHYELDHPYGEEQEEDGY